jgi:hypothetical protein
MKVIRRILLLVIVTFPFVLSACVSREFPVTQNYQETRYRTDTSTETFTENRTTVKSESGEFPIVPYYNWSTSAFYYYGYEIPDAQSYDNISLRLSVWQQLQHEPVLLRVFDMTKTGHIPSPEPPPAEEVSTAPPKWYFITGIASPTWLLTANTMIYQSRFLGATNYMFWKREDPQVIQLEAGQAKDIAIIITGPQAKWNCRVTVDVIWTRNTYDSQTVAAQRQVSKQVPYQVESQRTIYETRQVPFWDTFLSP